MKRKIPCPHCDGRGTVEEVVPPATPPGYKEVAVVSEYFGSHPEYGEGDRRFRVAIPEGEHFPDVRLTHGHHSRHWSDVRKFPSDTIIVEEGDESWMPITQFCKEYGLA